MRVKGNPHRVEEFIINTLMSTSGTRKVGVKRRKSGGKTYESPTMVLDSNFMDLVGRHFHVFRGTAYNKIETPIGPTLEKTLRTEEEGECLVLFFGDRDTYKSGIF